MHLQMVLMVSSPGDVSRSGCHDVPGRALSWQNRSAILRMQGCSVRIWRVGNAGRVPACAGESQGQRRPDTEAAACAQLCGFWKIFCATVDANFRPHTNQSKKRTGPRSNSLLHFHLAQEFPRVGGASRRDLSQPAPTPNGRHFALQALHVQS